MESGEGNAKRGCGRWMEECRRGAAVEQLTARGMEYQSPRWGAIENANSKILFHNISIPAMGGNRARYCYSAGGGSINPRDGGNSGKNWRCDE